MKFGAVVVTCNRVNLLKENIGHLLAQTVGFEKIIIVNNNSTDGTYEYLESVRDGRISAVHLNENIGGSGGFCRGVDESRKYELDWLLLIDDDAIINEDYNQRIAEGIVRHPECLAFSGTVMMNGKIDRGHRNHLPYSHIFKKVASKPSDYDKEEFDYQISTFCGLYVSTELISVVGLPESDFFIWEDDCEYSLRILQHSKIININAAVLDHRRTQQSLTVEIDWKRYYGIRNKIVLLKRYFTPLELFMYIVFMYMHIFKHAVLFLFTRNNWDRFDAKLMNTAVIDGLKGRMGKNPKYSNEVDIHSV